ncbi:MAG: flagellar protein FlgN [Lachnospiraceae bacterium]
MASLLENLIDTLKKENDEYEELLTLSQEKTGRIVSGDLEGLQDIVGREQVIIEHLGELEKKREECVADIGNVLNIPVGEVKVDKLVMMLEKQPADQKKLIQVHDRLKKTLSDMVKVNDNNKLLLQESLDMIEFELNLARSAKMAPGTANYGKGAVGIDDIPGGTGTFDAKQ